MRHVLGRVLFVLTALLSVALAGSVSRAEGVRVPNAFMTGQGYLALSAHEQGTYIMGPLFGASEHTVLGLQSCLQERNNIQIAAILSKYIQDRPERWHDGAHMLLYSRMLELCPGIREQ